MSREIKFRAWGRTLESDTPTMTEPFDFRKCSFGKRGLMESQK